MFRGVASSVVVACALALGGCAADAPEDLDPAGTLGQGEWSEDAPPEEVRVSSSDEVDPDLGTAVPRKVAARKRSTKRRTAR